MRYEWDPQKNEWLKAERNISNKLTHLVRVASNPHAPKIKDRCSWGVGITPPPV